MADTEPTTITETTASTNTLTEADNKRIKKFFSKLFSCLSKKSK